MIQSQGEESSVIEFIILRAYHPAAVALFFAVSHQPIENMR
jgi:hypothetical protein